MTVKNIRDLFTGTPIKNPTLKELADEKPDHVIYEQSHQDYMSNMPGDPKHPVEDYWRELARKKVQAEYAQARAGHEKAENYEPPEEEPQVVHPFSGRRI